MPVCQNCTKQFKNHVKIDGKFRNLKNRKFCIECSPFGQHNTSKQAPIAEEGKKICRLCKRAKELSEFYFHVKDDRYLSYCKHCAAKNRVFNQRRNKKIAVDYKGGKCQSCGYCKCLNALEFHHLDPTKKEFGIGQMHCMGFDFIKPELDKCILLCKNCHAEAHDKYAEQDSNLQPAD